MPRKRQDASKFIGEKHGRLLVTNAFYDNSRLMYECLCDCGNVKTALQSNILSGSTKSCGCLKRESNHLTTHGLSRTRFHTLWNGLIARTRKPNSLLYEKYGAIGYTVSDRWLDFNNFAEDMYERYQDTLKSNKFVDGNEKLIALVFKDKSLREYNAENCKFISRKECHKKDDRYYTDNNGNKVTISPSDLKRIDDSSISDTTIIARLKRGHDIDTAVGAKLQLLEKRKLNLHGFDSVAELCEAIGVSRQRLYAINPEKRDEYIIDKLSTEMSQNGN